MQSTKRLLSLLTNVYRSEHDLPELLRALDALGARIKDEWDLECVFVCDGSPDRSDEYLLRELPKMTGFSSQLHILSRNFGATYALQYGLSAATGDFFAPVPPDMQDPPELMVQLAEELRRGDVDLILASPESREDPFFSKAFSNLYWAVYRRMVNRSIPNGGIGFFICTRDVRDSLVALHTQNTFLFGEIMWLGYRRAIRKYAKRGRKRGRSSWTITKKMRYLVDSVVYSSIWPIRMFAIVGATCTALSLALAVSVAIARLQGRIILSGYASIVTLVCVFGSLSITGIGIVGEYVGRVLANVQNRPTAIVSRKYEFNPRGEVKHRKVEVV